MSQFNKKLDQAKNRQKRIYLFSGLTVMSILFLVAVLFVFSRGTRVEIMPIEANELATISVIEGFSFSIGDVVYSLAGNPVISASAPGFKVATKTIDPVYLGKVFPLELFELPGRLVIKISGNEKNLSKTAWQINGHDADLSDKLDLELEAGSYTVTINNPFFQSKVLTVEIKRRKQTKLQVDLQPVEGMLNISSKPDGAKVFLNEKVIGQTPLEYSQNGGLYTLRVTAENYADTIEQFEITRSKPEVNRNYQLEYKKTKVALKLTPEGGTLLVNGVQAKEPLFLNTIVEHRLTYMKAGYYTETKSVQLAADQEKEISFQLKPEIGQVKISSSPPASIWINNKDYGISPVNVSLPAVTHQIIFKKPGYRSVSRTVKPTGKSVQKISATLLTEYQARLQEAPRELTNQAGIKLKLFVMRDHLTMGAPRSEKGQRANEFQRNISLTKPFYASIFEITNSQFAKFNPKKSQGAANVPITSISWQEAASYCNWLSKKEKLQLFYEITKGKVNDFNANADGYRLLSEAEWEWLARKSGKTKQTIFSWGNETIIPPNTANIADETAKGQVIFYVPNYNDSYVNVAPVGSFNRELSGLYDMAGNVSEWVHDVYLVMPPMTNTTVRNPMGEQRGQSHVIKGANFRSGSITMLRPAFREVLTTGRDDVGFRIGRYLYGGKNE
jgi:formylglycine-generating enzyme required for sulfatase activity